MKTLATVIISISLLFSHFTVNAQQALSKELVEQYYQTKQSLREAMDSHPEYEEQASAAMTKGKEAMFSFVKTLPFYPEMKQTVSNAGFKDFKDFLDTGSRVMGATIAVQMKKMPQGMDMDSYIKKFESKLESMKQQAASSEMASDFKASLTSKLEHFKQMKVMAGNASVDDIDFISKNLQWVKELKASEMEASEGE